MTVINQEIALLTDQGKISCKCKKDHQQSFILGNSKDLITIYPTDNYLSSAISVFD
jgi:hypothetical protein